jgi:hypothetical protein
VKLSRRRPGLSRGALWALLAASVLAVLGARIWIGPRQHPSAAPVRVLTVAPASLLSSVYAGSSLPPAAMRSQLEGTAVAGTERIEVCGLGWVEAQADGTLFDNALFNTVPGLVESRRAIVDSLRAGGDEFGNAAAVWLEMNGGRREIGPNPAASLYCSGPTSGCEALQQDRPFVDGLLEQLARLGAATRDPRVYALAFKACSFTPTQGSCALLNVDQWALLDDGNAAPWLFALSDSETRKDPARAEEALFRIGSARRVEDRLFAVAGLVAAQGKLDDGDVLATQSLAVGAFNSLAVHQPPLLQSLLRACRGEALANGNRRQACDAAAVALADRSDTMMDASVGAGIGSRVGWPDERVDAVRGLQIAQGAYLSSSVGQDFRGGETYSCAGARRTVDYLARQASVGEVQAVRDWLDARGKSLEPFALAARAQRLKREATAVETQGASAPAGDGAPLAAGGAPPVSPYFEAPPPAR